MNILNKLRFQGITPGSVEGKTRLVPTKVCPLNIRDAWSTVDITMAVAGCTMYSVHGCSWLFLGLPCSVSDHHRMVLNGQTYKWIELGWDWLKLVCLEDSSVAVLLNNWNLNIIWMDDFELPLFSRMYEHSLVTTLPKTPCCLAPRLASHSSTGTFFR